MRETDAVLITADIVFPHLLTCEHGARKCAGLHVPTEVLRRCIMGSGQTWRVSMLENTKNIRRHVLTMLVSNANRVLSAFLDTRICLHPRIW